MSENSNTAEVVATAAPLHADIAKELGEELQKEGIVPAKAEVKAEEPVKDAEGEEVPDTFKKGFEKLLKKQAQVREESSQAKHAGKLATLYSPEQATAVERALQSRDPMALLVANGFSYADVTRQLMTGKAEKEKAAEVKPAGDKPKLELPEELQTELAELRKFREEFKGEKAAKTETQVLSEISTVVGDNYPYINDAEDHNGVKLMIEELYVRGGNKFPEGLKPRDVIELCAEEYNERMARFDKKLENGRKRLTSKGTSVSTGDEATRETPKSAPVASGAAKTLTNKLATPASAPSSQFNLDDALKELVSDSKLW